MSDLGYNVWGAVTGVIGTLSLIPIFLAWLQTRLPSSRIPHLLALRAEILELFTAAILEGLITDEKELYQLNRNVWAAKMQADEMRAKVYAAQTWWQDVKNWWQGLSGRVMTLCEELNFLRMKLAERNTNERKRLASAGIPADLPLMIDDTGVQFLPQNPDLAPPAISTSDNLQQSAHASLYARAQALLKIYSPGSDTKSVPAQQESVRAFNIGSVSDQSRHHWASTNESTHDLVSDADLHALVMFALACSNERSKGAHVPSRGATLSAIGKKHTGVASGKRYGKRAVAKALIRLLKRLYAARLAGGGTQPLLDPESLLPLKAGDRQLAGDEWEDV
ncbi:hypothetical protein GY45DRAFT_1376423 [Cubamyces sp. BRFM 1775]|nr:hypothetical protein GY45DRAFT_1376423 [Cubamyces sp. BRFM 1775]